MAATRVFASTIIVCVLNIVTSTKALPYTYITKDMVEEVYAEVGYNSGNSVEKSLAEGDAISRALKFAYPNLRINFLFSTGTEFIVASATGKSAAYIYGEAARIEDSAIGSYHTPQQIVIVYTLHYASSTAETEYHEFMEAVTKLRDVCATHKKVFVLKQFRPVSNNQSELVVEFDYQNHKDTIMTKDQEIDQHEQIIALHQKLKVEEAGIIGAEEFANMIEDSKVSVIVDGIIEGVRSPNGDNQLLTAIPRAQVRIMATAIKKKGYGELTVIVNDIPSGMDEYGNWTIDEKFSYKVDIILSCVWHKKFVDYEILKCSFMAIPLDIIYNGQRLFEALFRKLIVLQSDVHSTLYSTKTEFDFAKYANGFRRLLGV